MGHKATKTRSIEMHATGHKCKCKIIKLSQSILNNQTTYLGSVFTVLWAAPILTEDIKQIQI